MYIVSNSSILAPLVFDSWYSSHDGKTPLLCAAEAGHDEILAYLLQFTKVQTDLKRELGKVPSASVSYSHNLSCDYIWGEPERAPHQRDFIADMCVYVCLLAWTNHLPKMLNECV